MVLLLWILFVIYVSFLSLLCCRVCPLQPCDHLLKKGRPLGSLVCCVFLCFCHLPNWCFGSGMVLDCIDSRSMQLLSIFICFYLFCLYTASMLFHQPQCCIHIGFWFGTCTIGRQTKERRLRGLEVDFQQKIIYLKISIR